MSTFNLKENEPYLKCNMWEIKQYPRFGEYFNYFVLNDIFYHNSLGEVNEEKQQSSYIIIPEPLLGNPQHRDIVFNNIDEIIDNKIPIIKKINDETWVIDLSFFEKRG